MANRFNFVSPGAHMADGMRSYLLEREMQRRAEVAEAEQRENLKLRQAADARAATAATSNEQTAALQREAAQAALTRGQRGDVVARAAAGGVGGDIPPELQEEMARLAPEMMQKTPATFQQGAQTAVSEDDIPTYAVEQTAPERNVFKGTPEQRIFKELQDNPDMTARDIMLKLKGAGMDLSAGDAKILAGEDETETSWQRFNGTRAGSKENEMFMVNPKTREIKDSQGNTVTDKITPVEGQEGMAFAGFTGQTAQGVQGFTFNKKTGQWTQTRMGDLRPGATAERELNNGILVNNLIGDIEDGYTPEKVGVIAGRLKNLDQKYWGSDPEYASLKQNLTTLANTIIQLRTGAQMSVQEAERIANEVANETLPPVTFMARMKELKEQYREYVQIRAKTSYGRMTTGDVDTLMETGGLNLSDGAAPGTTPKPAGAAPVTPAAGAGPAETDEQKRARLRKKYLGA